MRILKIGFVALFLALLIVPASAYADQLNFTVTGFTPSGSSASPGSIVYGGAGGPLVATNVQIQDVTGVGTPANNGYTALLSNAVLNFTTGNFSGNNSTSWFFGPGGSISLVGGMPDAGIPDGTTLFSGSFSAAATVTVVGTEVNIVIALFGDTKDPNLVSFYGLPNSAYLGSLQITFELYAQAAPPQGFSSWTILNGAITNTPVPEPGTMALFGTGLIGLAMAIRRRLAS